MLAYREKVLKKRLAYSTVSQLSYILFGLAIMDTGSVTGGLLHVLAHGFIKSTLFLCAGAIIYTTGKTRVDELRGIGKEMPLTMWCYTIVSLGLIGIPPTGGFVSKWYIGLAAVGEGSVASCLGFAAILISALLTAIYMFQVVIKAWFPTEGIRLPSEQDAHEAGGFMTVPMLILAALCLLMGLFPDVLLHAIREAVIL